MIRKAFHFGRKFVRPHITPRNTKYFITGMFGLYLLEQGYDFYDDYACKHEALRRIKKHFFDDEEYVLHNSLSFWDYWHKNYTRPMINIEPRSFEEVDLPRIT